MGMLWKGRRERRLTIRIREHDDCVDVVSRRWARYHLLLLGVGRHVVGVEIALVVAMSSV